MPPTPRKSKAHADTQRLAQLFEDAGWHVDVEPIDGEWRPDLVLSQGATQFAVEVKSMGEGRADRALPLLSQSILQATHYAKQRGMRPMAVISVDQAHTPLIHRIQDFRRRYAPDVAVGILVDSGAQYFFGDGLEAFNAEPRHAPRSQAKPKLRQATELFSDLNQWMLKVLLAPELPEQLLAAPRVACHTATQLADVAQVSPMTANRFVRRLQEEGLLEHAPEGLRLVRRRELFRRWQSAAMRSTPEIGMSFLLPGDRERNLRKVAEKIDACVGLFAAADMLALGHVIGATPYLYVRRLRTPAAWPNLVPSSSPESTQVIIRQAATPESIFRGAVSDEGVQVSDVLQIWLDVSAHPSRGAEQAEFIRGAYLAPFLGVDA